MGFRRLMNINGVPYIVSIFGINKGNSFRFVHYLPAHSESWMTWRCSTSPANRGWRTASPVDNFTLNIALLLPVPLLTGTGRWGWFDHEWTRYVLDNRRRCNSVLPVHLLDALLALFADVFRQPNKTSNIFLIVSLAVSSADVLENNSHSGDRR